MLLSPSWEQMLIFGGSLTICGHTRGLQYEKTALSGFLFTSVAEQKQKTADRSYRTRIYIFKCCFSVHNLHLSVFFNGQRYPSPLFYQFLTSSFTVSLLLLQILIYKGRQLITFCHSGRIKITKIFEGSILVLTGSWKTYISGTKIRVEVRMPTVLMLDWTTTGLVHALHVPYYKNWCSRIRKDRQIKISLQEETLSKIGLSSLENK